MEHRSPSPDGNLPHFVAGTKCRVKNQSKTAEHIAISRSRSCWDPIGTEIAQQCVHCSRIDWNWVVEIDFQSLLSSYLSLSVGRPLRSYYQWWMTYWWGVSWSRRCRSLPSHWNTLICSFPKSNWYVQGVFFPSTRVFFLNIFKTA